ncbi:hypothetical protein T440DRAFT_465408 [Plenodomus tracheiphilus IPT5]|uniref:Uncharacterized protein n=1 Tax=Plenodomus tracheiphilus IPT5 TaxID=1408161 RepID=A0A6A7BGF5_9PLEO|nr:hypothetical protein T440DRAFT_465408 [Plenodomus tracheiphilus IPT5]
MAGIDEAGLTSVTHPSVYSYNDEFPPLTTLFTYAPECTDHWVLSGGSHDETVYSAGIFGTHWQSCQPSYGSSIYSPGICPSGYAINTVTELGTSAATGGSDDWKMWQALCCPA